MVSSHVEATLSTVAEPRVFLWGAQSHSLKKQNKKKKKEKRKKQNPQTK